MEVYCYCAYAVLTKRLHCLGINTPAFLRPVSQIIRLPSQTNFPPQEYFKFLRRSASRNFGRATPPRSSGLLALTLLRPASPWKRKAEAVLFTGASQAS